MNGARKRVSPAQLAATVVLLGLLGARYEAPAPVVESGWATARLGAARGGCSPSRDLRFEMLPADAEPRFYSARRTPVCLAVFRETR